MGFNVWCVLSNSVRCTLHTSFGRDDRDIHFDSRQQFSIDWSADGKHLAIAGLGSPAHVFSFADHVTDLSSTFEEQLVDVGSPGYHVAWNHSATLLAVELRGSVVLWS